MIIIIRISGLVEVSEAVNEALSRLRLRRKFSAVLLPETPDTLKIIAKVRNFVAFGQIDKETLTALITQRVRPIGKNKLDIKKILAEIDKKSLLELGVKPFFRLHPPRKGIDSKLHYPQGVLGDNKQAINLLVKRML